MYIPEIIPEDDRKILKERYRRMPLKQETVVECPALLVVDMTYGFIDDRFPTGYSKTAVPCLRNIKSLIDFAREKEIPIIYTKDISDPRGAYKIHRGAWNFKFPEIARELREKYSTIHSYISPRDEDIVIQKSKPSAFFGTPLEAILNYLKIDSIIVTGMTTSGCVRASVVDAFSYNYRVVIPIECVADRFKISHEVTLFDLDAKYANVMNLENLLSILDKYVKWKC